MPGLCLLGARLRRIGFFTPLEAQVQIKQKAIKYAPVQKLEMVFVSLLAGAKAVAHTVLTLRVDPALCTAFGLPGGAEQSVISPILDAATEADVAALRVALAELFRSYGQGHQHDFAHDLLVLDVDLSPLPASKSAERPERGYMGRSRSKTGGRWCGYTRPPLQETNLHGGHLRPNGRDAVGPANGHPRSRATRFCWTEKRRPLALGEGEPTGRIRGRGSEPMITWLLERDYQVTGTCKSTSRVRKLVLQVSQWQESSSPGREVALVPELVAFARPLTLPAVRTPSEEKAGGYYYAVCSPVARS